MTEVIVNRILVPSQMIYKSELYRICDIKDKYIIRKYKVLIEDEKIYEAFIDAFHPNSDPSTGEFCIPNDLKQCNFDNICQSILENIFITFNIDDCYFTPWGDIEYRKR